MTQQTLKCHSTMSTDYNMKLHESLKVLRKILRNKINLSSHPHKHTDPTLNYPGTQTLTVWFNY